MKKWENSIRIATTFKYRDKRTNGQTDTHTFRETYRYMVQYKDRLLDRITVTQRDGHIYKKLDRQPWRQRVT